MNKKRVEDLIPYAIKCIEKEKNIFKNGKVPNEFNGYISSFGASIIQSGILATVTFFNDKNSSANEERFRVPELIFNILKESDTVQTEKQNLKDYLLEENKKSNDQLKKAKYEIINAAIALKLGIRVFEFGDEQNDRQNSQKKSKKSSDDRECEKKTIKLIIETLKKSGINLDDKEKMENCERELEYFRSKINKKNTSSTINELIGKGRYISKIINYFGYTNSNNLEKCKNKILKIIEDFLRFIPLLKLNPNEVEGNLSYLYYKDYFDDLITDNFSKNEEDNSYYFDIKNEQLIYRSKREKLNSIDKVNKDNESFILKTTYPGLLIGSGYNHKISKNGELKLGLEFDYTSGIPIINGSSVKGVLRSVFYIKKNENDSNFEENNNKNKEKLYYINSILNSCIKDKKVSVIKTEKLDMSNFEVLTNEIFEGKKDNKTLNIYERDVFFDAVIDLENTKASYILGEDYITPHKSPLKNPVPIKFLKVMPDVAWRFEFNLKDGILSINQKRELFKAIIKDIGIGAKTNLGYGALIDIEDIDTKDSSNLEDENLISSNPNELTPQMLLALKQKFNG
ncbi:CRISPR type III-B/RAMP module RAMP protein Cmr6 [Clostridium sp. DSM 8431]|uniref:type III-B CRISPR module RAMP protein Cmr6 n=1 Tax=Clostridium sp. DSM 8431 TaxID=1761781 RepID=UPI0008E1C9F1|nr:type III-B CRISPR module RAMP protein Cmr6 [Clostridium sp. DSM 8431]SFU71107.1 CRISPR type III-B/RAMP module RAMP protein Cmr6 [Clostridium sp. DSM 8431]